MLHSTVRSFYLLVLCSFVSVVTVFQRLTIPPNEFFSLVLFVCFYLLFRYAFQMKGRRIHISSAVLALVFSLFSILARIDLYGAQSTAQLSALFHTFGLTLIYHACLIILISGLDKQSFLMNAEDCSSCDCPSYIYIYNSKGIGHFFLSWVVLSFFFLLWLPNEFPGWLTADSSWQLMQVRGEMPFSNHHPIAHTMVIYVLYHLGLFLFGGNENAAVALYTVFQVIFFAGCFSYLLATMKKMDVHPKIILAVLLFLIFIPYYGSYSIAVWKDIPFGGSVLVLSTALWRLTASAEQGHSPSVCDRLVFFLSSLCMCLFRSNGIYAYIALIPFLFFFFRMQRCVPFLSLFVLTLALLIKGPVYDAAGVIPPDPIESLSIPTQHIFHALMDGAELTEEQSDLLSQVLDIELAKQVYSPYLSDPIKVVVRYSNNQEFILAHKWDFFKLWLDLGVKHPGSYLRAQIELTRSYWYPMLTSWQKTYYEIPPGSSISFLCMYPAALSSLIYSYCSFITKLPIIGLLFSIGAVLWLYLFLFVLCIVKRQYTSLLIFIPTLAVWATLLVATPLDNSFRYAYTLFVTLPLILVLPFCPTRQTG